MIRRGREEYIRCEAAAKCLGKQVAFVSEGMVSGTDEGFLAERTNERLDGRRGMFGRGERI